MKSLKRTLDKFYRDFDFKERLLHDPIEFPHRYEDRADAEVAGFIASCFAYGRVGLFKPVVEKILSVAGDHPAEFLRKFTPGTQRPHFTFKYRFNESRDILCLLFLVHVLLKRHASLEKAFRQHYSPRDPDTGSGIVGLIDEIMSIDTSPVYGANIHPPGLTQFFPSPAGGSACKRMNLFLRWMVRDRDIDLGIWKGIPAGKLVIPLDTHIAKIARCLGFTGRSSPDWKAAIEITNSLRELDPEDPLKYDFALCHHGISGVCKRRGDPACGDCVFYRPTGKGAPRTS